jgi:hypothetical protein
MALFGKSDPSKELAKEQAKLQAEKEKLEKELKQDQAKAQSKEFKEERKQDYKGEGGYTKEEYKHDKKNAEKDIKVVSERERDAHRATEKSLKKAIPNSDKEARKQRKEERKIIKKIYKREFDSDKVKNAEKELSQTKKEYYKAKAKSFFSVPFTEDSAAKKELADKAEKAYREAQNNEQTLTSNLKKEFEVGLADNKLKKYTDLAENREAYAEQMHDRHQHVQDKLFVKALHLNPPLMLTERQQDRLAKINKLPDGDRMTKEIAKEKKHLREYVQGPITRDDKGMISVEFKHPSMDKDKSVFYKINPNNPDPKTFELVDGDGVSVDGVSALKPTTIAKPNFDGKFFGIKNEQRRLHNRERKEEKVLHKDDAKFQKTAEKKAEIEHKHEKKQRKSEYKEKKEDLKREIKEAKKEFKTFEKMTMKQLESSHPIKDSDGNIRDNVTSNSLKQDLKNAEVAKSKAFKECLKHPFDSERRNEYKEKNTQYKNAQIDFIEAQQQVYEEYGKNLTDKLTERDKKVVQGTEELNNLKADMAQRKNDAKIVKDLKLTPPVVATADQAGRYNNAISTKNHKAIQEELTAITDGKLKYVQGNIERVGGKIRVEYKHPDGDQKKNIYCFIDPKTKRVEQYGYEPEARAMVTGQTYTGPDGRTHNYMIIDAPSAPAPRDMGVGKVVNNASPVQPNPSVGSPAQPAPVLSQPPTASPQPDKGGSIGQTTTTPSTSSVGSRIIEASLQLNTRVGGTLDPKKVVDIIDKTFRILKSERSGLSAEAIGMLKKGEVDVVGSLSQGSADDKPREVKPPVAVSKDHTEALKKVMESEGSSQEDKAQKMLEINNKIQNDDAKYVKGNTYHFPNSEGYKVEYIHPEENGKESRKNSIFYYYDKDGKFTGFTKEGDKEVLIADNKGGFRTVSKADGIGDAEFKAFSERLGFKKFGEKNEAPTPAAAKGTETSPPTPNANPEAKPKEVPREITPKELMDTSKHGVWEVTEKKYDKENGTIERTLSHDNGKNQLKEIRDSTGKLLEVHVLKGDAAITLDRKGGVDQTVGKQVITFKDGKPIAVENLNNDGQKIPSTEAEKTGRIDVKIKKFAQKTKDARIEVTKQGEKSYLSRDNEGNYKDNKVGDVVKRDYEGKSYTVKKITDGHKKDELRDVDIQKVLAKNSSKYNGQTSNAPSATPVNTNHPSYQEKNSGKGA